MKARQLRWLVVALLFVSNVFVLLALFPLGKHELTVAFLDVGQGDAILITGPTGTQMLIDGGRDRTVLRELAAQMSPLDRTIDVVVATHPDADHIGGLPDVLKRYKVGAYLFSGVENDTTETLALEDAADKEEGAQSVLARRGMRIDLGKGVYADILFPDRDVSGLETNTASIIMRLTYGTTEFLLTGDAPESIENYLVSLDGGVLRSEVLKAGHHGSRTSTGEVFLNTVAPALVVVSAGANNSYGHPHDEVVARIEASGATLVSTMGKGAVVLVSDGTEIVKG